MSPWMPATLSPRWRRNPSTRAASFLYKQKTRMRSFLFLGPWCSRRICRSRCSLPRGSTTSTSCFILVLARSSPVGLSAPMEMWTGWVMNVAARSRTEGGQVAVNMRVCRPFWVVVPMILRISSSKPLSSMRSASSNTR